MQLPNELLRKFHVTLSAAPVAPAPKVPTRVLRINAVREALREALPSGDLGRRVRAETLASFRDDRAERARVRPGFGGFGELTAATESLRLGGFRDFAPGGIARVRKA